MGFSGNVSEWGFIDDKTMAEAVRHARIPLIISDPKLHDNPIVFANSAFYQLTGYSSEEIIGQNCRILQGEGTSQKSIEAVRGIIENRRVDSVEILNYKKDGTSFVNSLQIGPIHDSEGKLVYYFGSQLDVTDKHNAELEARKFADEELIHRLRNIVNVMTVIVKMTAREEDDLSEFSSKITERIRILSDAHFQTINQPDGNSLSFHALTENILLAYAPKGPKQYTLTGPQIVPPRQLVSCISLSLHELATNSVKYGALGSDKGEIDVQWRVQKTGTKRTLDFHWRELNGPMVSKPSRRSGSKIIYKMIQALGGTITLDWKSDGLVAMAQLPLLQEFIDN
ncbi:PAS domain-containing protein [Ahrensia kielensis]|uniref:Blue-light-activated histidine kinase n=1 Tax=Ahrensia kielensis TaxID=76980 RepID=A0ABU9TAN9_9HYPH